MLLVRNMMLLGTRIVQTVTGCIGCALIFCGGAYLAWLQPRRVRHEVEENNISDAQGREKLRQFSPVLGYLVMILALLFGVAQFL